MIKTYLKLIVAIFFSSNVVAQSAWITYNTSNSGILSNSISSIKIDTQGNKWIGTNKGLCKFDGTNWKTYTTSNSGLTNNTILSITIDDKGNVWMGTAIGLCKFDGTNWTSYKSPNSIACNSIAIDLDGTKWVASTSGVWKFDGVKWLQYNSTNSGIIDNLVYSIVIDSKGVKWIATASGVSKFDGTNWINYYKGDKFGSYLWQGCTSIIIDKKGNKLILNYADLKNYNDTNWVSLSSGTLSNNGSGNPDDIKANTLVIDNQNHKWYGTAEGVYQFDNINLKKYTKTNSGLASNKIYSIAVDIQDRKWIGTDSGLVILSGSGDSKLCNTYYENNCILLNYNKNCGNSTLSLSINKDVLTSYKHYWILRDSLNNEIRDTNSTLTFNNNQLFKLTHKITGVVSPYGQALQLEDNYCHGTIGINLPLQIKDTALNTIPICMVTNQNGYNLIVWDNLDNKYVSTYRIYKQNQTTSKYDLVHEQSKHLVSEWLDTLSKPNSNIDRYKISIIDSCGNETSLSSNHTTMLLSSNVGLNGTVNLSWNKYEGFDYQNFEIWRSTDGVNFNLISTVANNSYAYIDNTPPTTAWYQVRITKSDACNPSKRIFTSVNSNIISKEGKSLGLKAIESELLNIYPNPAKGSFVLNSSVLMLGKSFDVVDVLGRVMYSSIINSTSQLINIENLEIGTYFITSKDISALKLIKE